MLAAATLTVLTVLPAGVAQASQAEERGQRVLERTLAREHHTVAAPANPAAPAAEPYRNYHEALAAQEQATEADAVERFRRSEWASHEQSATSDVGQQGQAERWNSYYQATRMSPAELKAWMEATQRANNPTQVSAPLQPAQPTTQPIWLVLGLGVVAAALALSTGVAVLAARRANRRARVGQAA
jgi:hypothetical protein